MVELKALVALHVLAAIRVGGGGWRDLQAVAAAPFYLLWKLSLFKALLRGARQDAAWVRTDRAPSPPSAPNAQAAGMRSDSPDSER